MAATKKTSAGKAPKAKASKAKPAKAPKPERTIPKKPRREKPKKSAAKASKAKPAKAPKPSKAKPLTAEQRAMLPSDLLAAADGGDQSAAAKITEIVHAQDSVLAAEANQKQVRQDCKTRTEQEKAAFEQSIEASYRSDAGPEVIKSKLEDIQSKYQDYKEALALNAEERKAATSELREAKKRRDEAIEGAAQLNLPFDGGHGKTVAVRDNGDEIEVSRDDVEPPAADLAFEDEPEKEDDDAEEEPDNSDPEDEDEGEDDDTDEDEDEDEDDEDEDEDDEDEDEDEDEDDTDEGEDDDDK
jgi:hypothetical protein